MLPPGTEVPSRWGTGQGRARGLLVLDCVSHRMRWARVRWNTVLAHLCASAARPQAVVHRARPGL